MQALVVVQCNLAEKLAQTSRWGHVAGTEVGESLTGRGEVAITGQGLALALDLVHFFTPHSEHFLRSFDTETTQLIPAHPTKVQG